MKRAMFIAPVVLLAACSAAPPAEPPACPKVAVVAPAPSVSAAPSASVKPAGFTGTITWQEPKDAAKLGFCTEDELSAARDELGAVARLIRAMPRDASDASAITGRLVKLYESRCYLNGNLARELDVDALKAARAWQLAAWWEKGGEAFFSGALHEANTLRFAGSIPPMLAAELLPPQDPLRLILCPSSAAECDPAAQAAALDVNRELERVSAMRGGGPTTGRLGTSELEQECARGALGKPAAERLMELASCLQASLPVRSALPMARYRSPKAWLVLRGRRGHYSFCDGARAYDLETGSAYVVSHCGGLVLRNNGSVDIDATRNGGALKTQVGTMSVDALRRLAMMLLLDEKLAEMQRPYAKLQLPVGVPMPDRDEGFGMGMAMGSFYAHSGQTAITFELFDGKSVVRSGRFTWPDSADNADQVIDDLVVSAETTLVEGCPAAALPAGLFPASSLGGVSKLDASADDLRKTADILSATFDRLHKIKICKKK